MLAIARALIGKPKLLMLDEPSVGLAPAVTEQVFEILAEERRKGMTILLVEQLAYIARKLDTIQEGERTALDNSMLMFCSSMMSGSHDATQLPVVMVGRGGGKIQTGRVLDYRDKPNRQMCRLYLSMMDKMKVRPCKFGDATEAMAEV